MEPQYELYYEALKMLKEWSTALVVIQTGALAVIGGLVKNGITIKGKWWVTTSLGCFLVSILIAANVLGAIPSLMQKLPLLVEKYADIYKMPNYFHIPLWMLALGEHLFFILGLVSFTVFAITQAAHSRTSTHHGH